jgi:hypothetical protein
MVEIKDMENPEEFLQQMRLIFEKREEEYLLRDEAHQEKDTALQRMLEELGREKSRLEKWEKELNGQQEERKLQEQELSKQFEELNNLKNELHEREEKLGNQEKNRIMKYNLMLENVRNEEMRLKRLTGDYDYKLSLMDKGMVEALQCKSEEVDLSKFILRTEHEESNAESNRKIEALQSERANLLKKILELNAKVEEFQTEREANISGSHKKEVPENEDSTNLDDNHDKELQDTNRPGLESQEELTAEVLRKYMERNETEFENLSIRHSDAGEQLRAECSGLQYRFLFTKPAQFDIFAERKKSSRFKKILAEFNNEYPGVQFRYEDQEGGVYATGYFTYEMKPYELMERVKEISSCFN